MENLQNLGLFTVDVTLQPDGKYDIWLAHEGSSGAHYQNVELNEIGSLLADEIEQQQKKKVTLDFTRDLLRFLDGKIAIHIADSSEYLGFIHYLQEVGVKLDNAGEYQDNPGFYDPKYPYFYMEVPEEAYMNANKRYENIVEYETHCQIEDCLEYTDLDFVKKSRTRNQDFDMEQDETELEI